MKVECLINEVNNKDYDALTVGKRYIVLSIEIYDKENSIFAQSVGNHILYRIENDNGSVVPYPSTIFQIISGNFSRGWMAIQEQGCFKLIPEKWKVDGFWESYYNDDSKTMELYENEKQNILLEELTNDEIISIISNKDSFNLKTILLALNNHEDERFIDSVLDYSKTLLQNDNNYHSSKKVSDLLVLAFTYLSKFKITQVEEFFIDYLTEYNQKEYLTNIVNGYFAARS
ncbi:hypothetical protein [Gorillibacterium sp. sgz5001074]|uniref:hypothetical protein n=1 Tax=Gorillibacterium sp. sgz5001074 TaxID=3446695 RepID=UPI003F678B80